MHDEIHDGVTAASDIESVDPELLPSSIPTLDRFPARKFFGFAFATMGGLFALAFLMRSIITGEAIPEGVNTTILTLTGGFGAYVASSSAEHIFGHKL